MFHNLFSFFSATNTASGQMSGPNLDKCPWIVIAIGSKYNKHVTYNC